MAETTNNLFTDRDQLTRLLRFLETDVGIGPGNEAKKQSSGPTHGRSGPG